MSCTQLVFPRSYILAKQVISHSHKNNRLKHLIKNQNSSTIPNKRSQYYPYGFNTSPTPGTEALPKPEQSAPIPEMRSSEVLLPGLSKTIKLTYQVIDGYTV